MNNNKIHFIKTKRNLNKKKRGFTLVELMVVLAIIATMTFIAVPNFTSIKTSVNEKVDKQSCEAIKRVVTTFIVDETIDTSKVTKFTYDANNKKINENISVDSESLKNALSDVKPPRTDNTKSYEISINKSSIAEGTNKVDSEIVSVMVSGNDNTKTE